MDRVSEKVLFSYVQVKASLRSSNENLFYMLKVILGSVEVHEDVLHVR